MNKVDSQGMNVFEGGFLGLDNITVVDRSEKLPDGAILEQSDATGWMGFFCLHMMRIAIELAKTNTVYESMATKFFEHFIYIGGAMKRMGGRGYQLWDEEDGFFYDVLRYPNGEFHKFRVRSLVGLIPLYAIDVLDESGPRDDADVHDRRALVHPQPAGSGRPGVLHGARDGAAPRRALDRRSAPARAAARSACGTRRSSCRRAGCAACRSITTSIRSASAPAPCATSRRKPT